MMIRHVEASDFERITCGYQRLVGRKANDRQIAENVF